jgi:hypothetical protein
MFRSYDHHQWLLLCLCNILLIGVHASLYLGVWPYVICALYVWCVLYRLVHDQISPGQELQAHIQTDGNDIRPHTAQTHNERNPT